MRLWQLQKGRGLLSRAGLLIILLLAVLAMYLYLNNKANPINQALILLSPWRNHRKYLIAQAKLESANFTSPLYQKNNNPLGMGHATKGRAASQLGEDSDYVIEGQSMQKYRNDTQGFRDMFDWYRYTNFPKKVSSVGEYVAELKRRGYFTLAQSQY